MDLPYQNEIEKIEKQLQELDKIDSQKKELDILNDNNEPNEFDEMLKNLNKQPKRRPARSR